MSAFKERLLQEMRLDMNEGGFSSELLRGSLAEIERLERMAVLHMQEQEQNMARIERLETQLAELRALKLNAVFVVKYGNYGPAEVNSVWRTFEEAEERATILGGDWQVEEWELAERKGRQA